MFMTLAKQNLSAVQSIGNSSIDLLWKEFFRDPSQWWDIRNDKGNARNPDFRHKTTKQSLWLHGWYNPPWVQEELNRRGLLETHMGKKQNQGLATVTNSDHGRFMSLLKTCIKEKCLNDGICIHSEILKVGILKNDPALGNTLIKMYGRFGMVVKAQEVFDQLPVRNVVSWTVLMATYCEHGNGVEAINCFEKMQLEGHDPDPICYSCILKACTSARAIEKGKQIYVSIIKKGLMLDDSVLGTTLVDMYAKCGVLSDAQNVFNGLIQRDVVSWTALITGYSHHGYGEEALDCFQQMQQESLSPNSITFASVIKACGALGVIVTGKEIHVEIVRGAWLEKGDILGTALIDMYAKCGQLLMAGSVFEELSVQDASSWNALLLGYCEGGYYEEVINLFERMKCGGISPDPVTFLCILKACGGSGDAEKCRRMHLDVIRLGLANDVVIGNAIIDMYMKCGVIENAKQLFDELPEHNIVSWNTLITGCSQHGHFKDVLEFFDQLKQCGLFPDIVTYSCILKSCGADGAIEKGKEVHSEIVRVGLFGSSSVLDNTLLYMYATCGEFMDAVKIFDDLPFPNIVSWTTLIEAYSQYNHNKEALCAFDGMKQEGLLPNVNTFISAIRACRSPQGEVKKGKEVHVEIRNGGYEEEDISLRIALVDMYAKFGVFSIAYQVFYDISLQNSVSWNAIISGYCHHGRDVEVIQCYRKMQSEGIHPDLVTFLCVLRACSSLQDVEMGNEVHNEIVRMGILDNDIMLGNVLIDMYFTCSLLSQGQQVFDDLPVHNIVSWNTLIKGYTEHGHAEQAVKFLEILQLQGFSPDAVTYACMLKACGTLGDLEIGKKTHACIVHTKQFANDLSLSNALIDMYIKCGALGTAHELFDQLHLHDVVTWTMLIVGYYQHGYDVKALDYFEQMQYHGISPNMVTFTCGLKACGNIGALCEGSEIHAECVRMGLLQSNDTLGTALIYMYVKCHMLSKAQEAFYELPVRTVACWNVLVAGFYGHEYDTQALDCLVQMESENVPPDAMTYSNIIKSCCNLGAIQRGKEIHSEIVRRGYIGNELYLVSALIEMYGACGEIRKAEEVFDQLPLQDVVSWTVLIAAYVQHGKVDNVFNAFEKMTEEGIKPDIVTFTILLTACSSSGLVDHGEMYFEMMGSEYGIAPTLEHFTCMIDLLGSAGELGRALSIMKRVQKFEHLPAWLALLGACKKWGNAELGKSVFQHAIKFGIDPSVANLYIETSDNY